MKSVKELKPSKSERKKELDLSKKIIDKIKEISGKEAVLVGSVAKNTCLSGDKDLDIFIMFDKDIPREELEKKGLEIGKKTCKALGSEPETHFAEHPYTKASTEGYDIDIVPCYRIERGEEIISAVDRSPLHTEYVKEHLDDPNEARLLKHFLKETGLYGAKISTQGFSGYLSELLVQKYGSFQEVLKNAKDWDEEEIIDLENYHDSKEELKNKFRNNFIVVDPVDKERNVAAAVSKKNYAKFIFAARQFLESGSLPEKASIDMERGKIFVIDWDIEKEIEEVLWGQLRRFRNKLVKTLERNEFNVLDSMVWTDCRGKAQILIEQEVWELPEVNDHEGPPVYDKKHSDQFLKKYDKVIIRGENIVTEREREYRRAEEIIKDLLDEQPSHLEEYSWDLKEDEEALGTRVGEEYSKKLWKVK